jgi:hypothetical protein
MYMRAHIHFALFLSAAACLTLQAQQTTEVKPLAARASPAEYQTAVKMGQYTLAVDFDAHGVPTSDGVFSDEDYIVFEVALYGPAGAHLALQYEDFSIRLNGKKAAAPAQAYTVVFKSLKSPEWEATQDPVHKESSSGINAGGAGRGAAADSGPPPPPKMPIDVERKMELRVQKAAVPEGDRPLPVAGLVFFQFSGKTKNIKSMDLIYSGAAGKATIPMQP